MFKFLNKSFFRNKLNEEHFIGEKKIYETQILNRPTTPRITSANKRDIQNDSTRTNRKNETKKQNYFIQYFRDRHPKLKQNTVRSEEKKIYLQ